MVYKKSGGVDSGKEPTDKSANNGFARKDRQKGVDMKMTLP